MGLITCVSVRFLATLALLGVLFFLSAGTFAYWEAWVYSGILFVSAAAGEASTCGRSSP